MANTHASQPNGRLAKFRISLGNESDEEADGHNDAMAFLTIPPILGAVTCLLGAVFAIKAVCNWASSGAPHGSMPV